MHSPEHTAPRTWGCFYLSIKGSSKDRVVIWIIRGGICYDGKFWALHVNRSQLHRQRMSSLSPCVESQAGEMFRPSDISMAVTQGLMAGRGPGTAFGAGHGCWLHRIIPFVTIHDLSTSVHVYVTLEPIHHALTKWPG